jgi:magnesium-transporting ATPase (P-type)
MKIDRNHINLFLNIRRGKKEYTIMSRKPDEEEKNLNKHARNLRLEIFLSLVFTIVTIFLALLRLKRNKRKMFNKTNKFISQALVTNHHRNKFLLFFKVSNLNFRSLSFYGMKETHQLLQKQETISCDF